MKDVLGGMGAAIGCVVKLTDKAKSDHKRTWVVSSITASTVTLNLSMPDGEEAAQQLATRDFIESFQLSMTSRTRGVRLCNLFELEQVKLLTHVCACTL